MSKELKIGLLFVVSILVMVLGINYLKGNYFFDSSRVYYGIYHHVSGLTSSNPITYQGLKVGQVRNIEISENYPGKLKVTFAITDDNVVVTKGTEATIESSLIGDSFVTLKLGASKEIAEPGDTLTALITKGLTETVYDEIEPIKAKSLELISSVDSLLELTRSILSEDARPHLTEGFESVSRGLKALEHSAYTFDHLLDSEKQNFKDIFSNLKIITDGFAANSENLDGIINNFANITDSLAQADIAGVVMRAGDAVKNVGEIMEKINVGDGSLAQLINNDSLHNSLTNATEDLSLLLEDMKAHPNRYIHFSVFGKKEKKLRLTNAEAERLRKLLNSNNDN